MLIAFLVLSLARAAQDSGNGLQEIQAKADVDAFFSGVVVEIANDRVTVSRTILGKPPERRAFAVTGSTKVEGKMKQKSRVTVRYTASDEGDVALSILVRDGPERPEKKK